MSKGDVALMNIYREASYSMILCSIQNKSSSPFLNLSMFLERFLILGNFSATCSYKKGSYKKKH